jgi:hypothetical protein
MRDTTGPLTFRSPIHWNTRPRNPSRLVGCKEHDDIGHVFLLADSFKRLYAERDLATRFEIRHLCFDDTWGNSISRECPAGQEVQPSSVIPSALLAASSSP